MARAVLGARAPFPWEAFEENYDSIREHIARVVDGCEDYNAKVRQPGGFILAHPPRDERRFPTPSGKAVITVNELDTIDLPANRLILQSLRSHDQFNTTTYSLNDRYRGVHKGRNVLFVNPEDLRELGSQDGATWTSTPRPTTGGTGCCAVRVISYPTARGCAATYFPEGNVLVPLEATAEGSNTPVSKAIIVRLEASEDQTPEGQAGTAPAGATSV